MKAQTAATILDLSPPVTFYQTTSALFVGLLVAVLLRDRHIDGSQGGSLTSNDKRRAALVAVVSIVMVAGEITSLLVLFTARATNAEHLIVGLATLLAVLGTSLLAVFTIFGRIFGENAIRLALRVAAAVAATLLGVGALFAAYLLGASTEHIPPGSINLPRSYRVFGTCASGACGLNERSEPTPYAKKLGTLQDGTTIHVSCQTLGSALATNHHTSRIWDLLANGTYVSDLFVSTPTIGRFAPELSRCPSRPITARTQG